MLITEPVVVAAAVVYVRLLVVKSTLDDFGDSTRAQSVNHRSTSPSVSSSLRLDLYAAAVIPALRSD